MICRYLSELVQKGEINQFLRPPANTDLLLGTFGASYLYSIFQRLGVIKK